MDTDFLNFTIFFKNINTYGWWRVLLELTLIGLVVTWVVGFLRGTRGARMLKGIAFVLISLYLVVQLVADQLDLQRIAFLYERMLFFASFAIVIVFQPELRRALMRLGETRLFRSFSSQINEEIEAVVEATTFLSRRKIGALIAIERDVDRKSVV